MKINFLAATIFLGLSCTATSMAFAADQWLAFSNQQKTRVTSTERLSPIKINESQAYDNAAAGGLWLPLPDGRRIYAKTISQNTQDNDHWTFVGTLPAEKRSVVITFGRNAVFGSIPVDNNTSLRIVTQGDKLYVAERLPRNIALDRLKSNDSAMASDYLIPPKQAVSEQDLQRSLALVKQAASATTPTVVDVLVGYTPGLVRELGSVDAVNTRINYLVAVTNRAYSDSQVNGRLRLIGTQEVNYTDSTTDGAALNDLTEASGTSSLAALHSTRDTQGADLVALLRPYHANQGACGVAWLNGGGLRSYNVNMQGSGYAAISDGTDEEAGNYCEDITFAHEIGHNLGLAHDKADSGPGAFTYAYGWRQTLDEGSFNTIMAYTADDQRRVPYFANPRITLCNGNPCGDVNEADQTRALNITMPIAANFRPTKR
ncbi:reprolysin-like metallopeptidase [Xanthomonas fragariae]|uniref:reprolysin-like metallopeptidase n=2 Tax=Xanthomonas fragariae TaxID=48664 RepID=UPI000A35C299|nr:M12 family metallo-peptidase [Xanthomonas fragariae]MDM7559427.1 M12 family metallo-peptidase [Xanthomonas fragariae]MDM7577114.1 M12 family metallo-peptidase [Xanthomonas fragariae]MDM7590401.1 M12 family metallo-peptidase [Xanthomonas fragariae]SMQ96181.1 putative secreted protein [Xanthomonas fragariae]